LRVKERNYTLKLQNDDYKGMDAVTARADFMKRVEAYEQVYEPVGDEEVDGLIAYIKLINVGEKVITRHCQAYIPSQIAFYLQNVHIRPHQIFLSLPAESVDLQDDRLLPLLQNAVIKLAHSSLLSVPLVTTPFHHPMQACSPRRVDSTRGTCVRT
jgi:hypothetical protein